MAELRDVMAYLLENYPHKAELSNARLTKMIYLADWLSVVEHDARLTPIKWYFDYFGPFVSDVRQEALNNSSIFRIESTTNYYGQPKELIQLKRSLGCDSLTSQDKAVLDRVINKCRSLSWNQFINFIYSTYPIATQPRFTPLDLSNLAKDYKNQLFVVS